MDKSKYLSFSDKSYRGIKGQIIARLMNAIHHRMHQWFAEQINIKSKTAILDIGCGGGGLLKEMLKKASGRIFGIDCSKQMVRLTKHHNKRAVLDNRLMVEKASVSKLPYVDKTFDLVTAFETIQFWPFIENDIKEFARVLKNNGEFCIMNRLPKAQSKWYNHMQLKTMDDYKNALLLAGFDRVMLDAHTKEGWIIIKATR